MATELSQETLLSFESKFKQEPRYRLAQNICTRENPFEVMRPRTTDEAKLHAYSNKVEQEGKPVTNQKASGRCWIFACLNTMRIPLMKEFNLEEFEFSQNYLFFWDKVERMNYILNAIIETAQAGEPVDGRLVSFLLYNPSNDGGQWHMLVNLVEKYGVVPKSCFPDAWSSGMSRKPFRFIINAKVREFSVQLRSLVEKGANSDTLATEVRNMIEEIYRICAVCLGSPPTSFTWEYYDKNKQYHKLGPISPLEFYRQHVKPLYNMEDKVVLTHDPRPENPLHKLYTVQYLGNVVGGRITVYINQPIDVLKRVAAESIRNNEAVWYGCDVGQSSSWKKQGLLDLDVFDTELVLGTKVSNSMTKADRLYYKESEMTHAMVLTAFHEEDGVISKWRVENSWGDDGGDKGYYQMTDSWFTEYVYEVVVDKKYIQDDAVLAILQQEPKVLPAWDPMGSLA